MRLLLLIKSLIFCLLLSTSVLAQEDAEVESYYDVGNISASIYQPIPFGDNFVNRGLSTNLGGQLESKFYLGKNVLAGVRLTIFGANVEDVTQTGNFRKTNVTSLGIVGGYKLDLLPRLELLLNTEIGFVAYTSEFSRVQNFTDTGYTIRVTPEAHYRITDGLGIFLAPEFRYDRLSIDTASEFEGYFNNLTYLTLSFGLRFTFRNDID